jgi:hypothetical protein
MMQLNDAEKVVIDGYGEWVLSRDDDVIRFFGEDGQFRTYPHHPLLHGSMFRECWINNDDGIALIVDSYGREVYKLDGKTGDIVKVVELNRHENTDRGLYFSRFEESGKYILFIYEGGIVCLLKNGELVWSHQHDKLDWRFVGVENGLVKYASEFRGEWGYTLSDGEKVYL